MTLVLLAAMACRPLLAGDLLSDYKPAEMPVSGGDRVTFIPKTDNDLALDGRLNEPDWQKAGHINRWVDLASGSPSEVECTMRILKGTKALYLGFTLHDIDGLKFKEPKGGDEYGGTVLEMWFDPNNNRRTKVQLVSNPLGMRFDRYDYNNKWTGKWQAKSVLQNNTWSMEVAIPYTDLNNQGNRNFWNANFCLVLQGSEGGKLSWTGGWSDPATDYGVLYFGDKRTYESKLEPQTNFYLDRKVYDIRDKAAKALFRIHSAGPSLDRFSANLQIKQGEKTVRSQTITPIPASDIDMTIDLQDLPAGKYTMQVDLVRAGKTIRSNEQPFEKCHRDIHPQSKRSGRVPIQVHPQAGLETENWLISTGVPFSIGSLDSPDNVRLIGPDGSEVPCHATIRSRWSPGGPIRWLGLDFIPTLSAKQQTFTLEYGPQVKQTTKGNLRVEQQNGKITVDTGPLRFEVNKNQFNLIAAAALNGRQLLGDSQAGLSLVDHEGNRYRAALDRDVQVTIESASSVSTTICAKGWYVREGTVGERTNIELPTDRLCLFTVRLTAWSGSPLVKMAVSTTITYDTTKVRLRELTIALPIEKNQSVDVGSTTLRDGDYLLQDRWDRAIDRKGASHPRSEGWVRSPDLCIAMRKFWQLFPKEISYANGVIQMHPWPAHGHDTFPIQEQVDPKNIYKLRYAHQGKELDFTLPDTYWQALEKHYTEYKYAGTPYYKKMSYANAQGLVIHNDLVLGFGHIAGDRLAKLVNREPHAVADPEYVCATNVYGPILHADEEYSQLERTFARGFKHLTTRTQSAGEYGQFIYTNTHNSWLYHENAAHLHRAWYNGHYFIPQLPFIQYARTGDPMWMQWGRDCANNLRDIAMVNYVSPQRSFRYHLLGAIYHCKGLAPWAGDAHVAKHPTCIAQFAYDYYQFGNRRSLDALETWIAGVKTANPGGYATREGMTGMGELLVAYMHTWDAALLDNIARFREAVLRRPLEDDGTGYETWDYHPFLFMRDFEFAGDERMIAAVRKALGDKPGSNSHYGSVHYDGYFAVRDDDPDRIKPYMHSVYQNAAGVIDKPETDGDGLFHSSWIKFAYQLHKYPYLLKGMKQFGLKPDRLREDMVMPLPSTKRVAYVAAREETDRAFHISIRTPTVRKTKIHVQVIRADGKVVLEADIQETTAVARMLEIPADGVASEYMIKIDNPDEKDGLLWPLTDLQHEIVLIPAGKTSNIFPDYRYQDYEGGGRLYFFAPTQNLELLFTADASWGIGIELLDANEQKIKTLSISEYVNRYESLSISPMLNGPLSLYITAAVMLKSQEPIGFALRPDALFKSQMKIPQ